MHMYLGADMHWRPGIHGGQKVSPGTGITGGDESPSARALYVVAKERSPTPNSHTPYLSSTGLCI